MDDTRGPLRERRAINRNARVTDTRDLPNARRGMTEPNAKPVPRDSCTCQARTMSDVCTVQLRLSGLINVKGGPDKRISG